MCPGGDRRDMAPSRRTGRRSAGQGSSTGRWKQSSRCRCAFALGRQVGARAIGGQRHEVRPRDLRNRTERLEVHSDFPAPDFPGTSSGRNRTGKGHSPRFRHEASLGCRHRHRAGEGSGHGETAGFIGCRDGARPRPGNDFHSGVAHRPVGGVRDAPRQRKHVFGERRRRRLNRQSPVPTTLEQSCSDYAGSRAEMKPFHRTLPTKHVGDGSRRALGRPGTAKA